MWRAFRALPHALAPVMAFLAVSGTPGSSTPSTLPVGENAPDSFPTTFNFGLTSSGTTDEYFTSALDLEAPLLIRGNGDFMAAARADARARLRLKEGQSLSSREVQALEEDVKAHLNQASTTCSDFLDSSTVYGHEEITTALRRVLVEKGRMALLLGGKSTGKSFLLKELAGSSKDIVGRDKKKRALLYVDARSCGGDLTTGLVAALQQKAREQERLKGGGYSIRKAQTDQQSQDDPSAPTTAKTFSPGLTFMGVSLGTDFETPGAGTLSKADQCIALLDRVAEVALSQGYYLCLIVDEANMTFPVPPDPSSAQPPPPLTPLHMQAQQQLEKLVQLTKQERKMNVLLVSSEYAYPFRLRHGRFFNTTNLTDTLFAGEVPPAAMRNLLLHKWGLGPRLTDVFLAFFGGHVHMASLALSKLTEGLDLFECDDVGPDGVLGSIVDCIEGEAGGDGAGPMATVLRALAEKGFAPVSSDSNAQAQALSLANVGGLVRASSKVMGLPNSLRSGANFGVVPSSQYTVRAEGWSTPSPPPSVVFFPAYQTPAHSTHTTHTTQCARTNICSET